MSYKNTLPTAAELADADENFSYEEVTIDISIGEERAIFRNLTQCRRKAINSLSGPNARWYQTEAQ